MNTMLGGSLMMGTNACPMTSKIATGEGEHLARKLVEKDDLV